MDPNGHLVPVKFMEATIQQYLRLVKIFLDKKLNYKNISISRWTLIKSAIKQYCNFHGGQQTKKGAEILKAIDNIPRPEVKSKDFIEMPFMLSTEETDKIFKKFGKIEKPYNYILQLLLFSGLRIGDIGRIRKQEIIEAQKTGTLLCQVKRGKAVPFPFSRFANYLEPLLKTKPIHKKLKDWNFVYEIFCCPKDDSSQAHYRSSKAFYHQFRRRAKDASRDAGLNYEKIHMHLFRHVFASQFQAAGGNPIDLQHALGHTDLKTTQKYISKNIAYHEKLYDKLDLYRFKKKKETY